MTVRNDVHPVIPESGEHRRRVVLRAVDHDDDLLDVLECEHTWEVEAQCLCAVVRRDDDRDVGSGQGAARLPNVPAATGPGQDISSGGVKENR